MKKLLMLIGALIMCNAYGDTETVYWNIDDNTTVTQCDTSNGSIEPPTTVPQKDGYHFMGWKEATEPKSLAQLAYFPFTGATKTPESMTMSIPWSVTTKYGTVNGTRVCSNTASSTKGTIREIANSTSGSGVKYTYCRISSFTINGVTTSVTSNKVAFLQQESSCNSGYGGYYCAEAVVNDASFRKALFEAYNQ